MIARVLLLVALLSLVHCRAAPRTDVVLATTTSVANSGLLDVLLEAFHQQHGMTVRSHLVGSGLALGMLDTGDADVVITHAPDAEAAALASHPRWRYEKMMFNDFVLVGPSNDPAGVRGASTAVAAMRRIAGSTSKFISRGDGSGTHERELALWEMATTKPGSDRYVAAGSGMGTTLQIASETGAYTLTDRATHAQFAGNVRLAVVFEGGPLLLNTYAVTMDPSSAQAREAAKFFDWLTGAGGRDVIDRYRIGSVRAFTVWPEGVPGNVPDARPTGAVLPR
jgi:tungstate transport system substrate-binding protein